MTPADSTTPAPGTAGLAVDVAIVGGGAAGLWVGNRLQHAGYTVVLLEAAALGGTQTLASQGLIHGGTKYALSGHLTPASEAIAGMPERWARCLRGEGEVDLSGLPVLSDRYYLFAADSSLGRLATFLASRALRGRARRLDRADYPPAFADARFDGVVYALDERVVDVAALVAALHAGIADVAYRHRVEADSLTVTREGVRMRLGNDSLLARRLLLAAGAGNAALLLGLGENTPRMQLRPLHQVVVRHAGLPALFAHCLTGLSRAEPRLTITSHPDGNGWLWYLGGQLAGDGATMTAGQLTDHARAELVACVPWIDWTGAELSTLRIDRAEPARPLGRRPDRAFAASRGPCVVAWPTKLSLVPDLGDRVLDLLPPPGGGPRPRLRLPPAVPGRSPWDGSA